MPHTARQMRSKSMHGAGEVKPGYQARYTAVMPLLYHGVNYVLNPRCHCFSRPCKAYPMVITIVSRGCCHLVAPRKLVTCELPFPICCQ